MVRAVFAFGLLLSIVAVYLSLPVQSGKSGKPSSPEMADFDGLAQAVFDTTVRIRNSSGTGSGSVIADLGDEYEIETNHHVAGGPRTRNVVDIWRGGDLVASKVTNTVNSWFEDGKSKDIAILRLKKSDLKQPLSVIPTAPPGYSKTIKAGDKIYTVGCSDARWPRARCGNVLSVARGLIFYDPKSIGGDSGSGVYHFSIEHQKWYCIGRTAWAIRDSVKRRWVGLAMDSDRVRAIREGRVSDGWRLPTGATPLDEIEFTDEEDQDDELAPVSQTDIRLPMGAIRCDLLPACKHRSDGIDPDPIDMGLFFNRESDKPMIPRPPKPAREGLGAGFSAIGVGLGVGLSIAIPLGVYLFVKSRRILI